jgi:hypothetical protein
VGPEFETFLGPGMARAKSITFVLMFFRRYLPIDVLSFQRFLLFDVFYYSTFFPSTFCPVRRIVHRRIFPVGVFYFNILSVNGTREGV